MHPSTFQYHKPTDQQLSQMQGLRADFSAFFMKIEDALPAGPDRTYVLRLIRDAGMWANVAITRDADGAPRA